MKDFVAGLRPTRPEAVDGAFAFGLIALALWAFQSAFGGTGFFIAGLIAAVFGLLVTHICLRAELPFIVIVGVWLAVFIVIGGVLAAPSQALLGFIPTPATVFAAVRTSVRGWKELLTTVPPVGRTGDLYALPVFCGMLGTGAGYLLARRLRWTGVAALPAFAVLALGILCGTREPVSVLLHGAVLALGVITWASVRTHRERPSLDSGAVRARRLASAGALLGIAAVIGLAVGDSVPLSQARDRVVWRDTFEPPFDPSIYPSPLGYYRQYVKELEKVPLFDVTGLPDGVPIRMATFDTHDGIVWKVTGGSTALRGSAGYFERVGTDVEPDYGDAGTQITIEFPDDSAYDEVWLPTVGEARSVSFAASGERSRKLADNFRYNRRTDTAAELGEPRPGDSYQLDVALPVAFDDLPNDAVLADVEANRLEPIEGIPGQVSGLGSGLVEEVDGIERVQILDDYLREGYYSDSADGQSKIPAGHGFGRLVNFADSDELVGNAEQYAATLGLVLRNSGIPARVVMGFVPKDYDPDGTVTISGGDAEAWVEVLVEDVGWVAVYPTPDRSRTTIVKDDTPKPIPDRETQVPPPPPVIEPDAETDPASESTETERKRPDEEKEDDAPAGSTPWLVIIGAGVVLLPLLIVFVVIGAIVLLKRRRRRRRQTSGRADERVAGGWRELVDYAVDSGRDVPSATTRREAAIAVGGEAAPTLARRADAAVFGPGDLGDDEIETYWAEVATARGEMRGDLGIVDRLKTTTSLESFRRAKSERRAAERRERQRLRRSKADRELVEKK